MRNGRRKRWEGRKAREDQGGEGRGGSTVYARCVVCAGHAVSGPKA